MSSSNKVIVVFKSDTPDSEIESAIQEVQSNGGKITQRYESALLGFAAELPDNSVQALSIHPSVDYLEPDGEVTAYTTKLLSK